MHGYYWDINWLSRKLSEFAGGQLRIRKISSGEIFQGKYSRCEIPDITKGHIIIHFEWLCELRFLGSRPSLSRWILFSGPTSLGFDWLTYYVQKERKNVPRNKIRGERLKFKPSILPRFLSSEGEELWLYKEGDPEFIKKPEN